MLAVVWFAVATSGFPSPFKSPAAMPHGAPAVAKSSRGANAAVDPGTVVFRKTEMFADPWPAINTSGLPSPLKSWTTTTCGLFSPTNS